MEIQVSGITDKGMVRAGNEDSFLIDEKLGLFVVADGMGGHKGGEVASHMATEIMRDAISASASGGGAFLGVFDQRVSREVNLLAAGIRLASRAIFEAAASNPAWQGMGTTVAAVKVQEGNAGIAHVGDSRVYLMRNGELRQLTEDHSLVAEQVRNGIITAEEAERSTRKNVITRALGQLEDIEVDMQDLALADGDRLLVCSDGLSNMVPDAEIAVFLNSEPDPATVCRTLMERANANGGKDNITVIVMACRESKGFMAGLKKMLLRD